MDLTSVTPVILTYNEAENIERMLSKLTWAARVVLVDSFSTDETVLVASAFPNVAVCQRKFDNHTDQWNFGLRQVNTEWVLTLDADYVCTDSFYQELQAMAPDANVYFAKFEYCVFGKPLPSSLYPPRAVLFRPTECQYVSDGHTQLLEFGAHSTSFFSAKLLHDDRKPLSRWFVAQLRYAELEADKLSSTSTAHGNWKDRIRRLPFVAMLLVMLYCLIAKGMVFRGRVGLYYTAQRVMAELILSLVLLDRKCRASLNC